MGGGVCWISEKRPLLKIRRLGRGDSDLFFD